MTVSELAVRLGAEVTCGSEKALARQVTGGYCCDLLSWVMGRARSGDAWVTIMSNANVAAVGLLADVSCVVLGEGVAPDAALLSRAGQEDIPLLRAAMSSFDACRVIHETLV